MDNLQRSKKAMSVMIIGTVCNLALFFIKLFIGLSSSSISILTDAINNLGDVVTCLISVMCFVAIKSNAKSDKVAFGYGRLEYVATFIMSLVISIVGVYFLITAVNRLMLATLLTFRWLYFGLMVGTVAVKIGMAIFYKTANKKLNSDVIRCAYYDSILDIGITVMAIIGLSLTKYAKLRLDAIFGIILSIFMIISGIKLCIDGLTALVGKKLDNQKEKAIIEYCNAYEGIEKVVEVEYHDYGVSRQEIIINMVFTKDADNAIINNITDEISTYFFSNYGFVTKIFIAER